MSDSRFEADEGEDAVARYRAIIASERAHGIHANKREISKAQARLRTLGAAEDEPAAEPDIGESLLLIRTQLLQHCTKALYKGKTPSTPMHAFMMVEWELRQNRELYADEERARELIQQWFAEHPSATAVPPDERDRIHDIIEAEYAALMDDSQMVAAAVADNPYPPNHIFESHHFPLGRARDPSPLDTLSVHELVERFKATGRDAHSTVAPALSVIAEDSDSLTSSEAALHALAPSANPPDAASVASSVMDAMAAMRTSDVVHDAVVGSEREAALVQAQQRAAVAEAQQQQMQAQFHQQMQMMEARMQAQLQQIQATVQQQPVVMPPTIQPTMHSSYPPTSAPVLVPAPRAPRAAAPAAPPAAASDSPAAGFTATWSQFKQFVQTSAPAAQRFRARIVDDQQQQIGALRSQVARLSGVLLPGDPEYDEVVADAQERFANVGAVRVFERRKEKLDKMEGELHALESHIAASLRRIRPLRLQCILYTAQVEKDQRKTNAIEQAARQRTARMKEENEGRRLRKEENAKKAQQSLEEERQERQQGIAPQHYNKFMPALLPHPMRNIFAAPFAAAPASAPASAPFAAAPFAAAPAAAQGVPMDDYNDV